jgi:hypothetical protein
MKYSDIITEAKTILEAANTGLQAIYTVFPKVLGTYPCAVIAPDGHAGEFHSLRDTKRQYRLRILVYGSLETEDTTEYMDAQKTHRDIVDKMIDAFEKQPNLSLNGKADWTNPTSGTFSFPDQPAKMVLCEIKVTAVVLFNRNS